MGMFTGMTRVAYKLWEPSAAIVAPIPSNPEQGLKQPVNRSFAGGGPGDVVASAFGTYVMFRNPLHSEPLPGSRRPAVCLSAGEEIHEGLAMPRRLHHQAAACTGATPHPRREHRKTTCRMSRNVRLQENRTAHR